MVHRIVLLANLRKRLLAIKKQDFLGFLLLSLEIERIKGELVKKLEALKKEKKINEHSY